MSEKVCLLLADDDPVVTDSLPPFLERAGFHVLVVSDGATALEKIEALHPDLVLLDVLMPRMDGREVLRRMRRSKDWTPAILLTRVGAFFERALALEKGADDYLNKPFDPHELLARIRAVLRRAQPGERSLTTAWRLACGNLTLERHARRVTVDDKVLDLTPKALAVLEYLMSASAASVYWKWSGAGNIWPGRRTVDTRVAELHRALGDDPERPRFIETLPGEGYRFAGKVRALN